MKRLFLFVFLLLPLFGITSTIPIYAAEQTDSVHSEEEVSKIGLPIIRIQTKNGEEPTCERIEHPEGCIGQSITNNNYVKGQMTIHIGDELLYNSGEYEKKKSGMRIKVRGNTSADFPCKSFKIKTEVKTDLFNRNDDKYKSRSWVLLNLYSTRDLRTILGCYVAKLIGIDWEPEHEFVNLFLNGEYRGLYMLSESVEASDGRCQLNDDTGLLMEADPYWWNEDDDEPVIKTKYLPYTLGYTFKSPDLAVDDPMLKEIEDYFNAFEDSLYNGKDISKYADLKYFAAWILTHDLLGTSDGAGANMYIMKNDFKDGEERYSTKLHMGPLWDFDSLLETPSKWCTCHDIGFYYYGELFKRPEFINEYYNLWMSIHEDIASKAVSYIKDFVSKYGAAIDESRKIAPPDPWVWRKTTADNLKEIEDWFNERIPWLDSAISELFIKTNISQTDYNIDSEITSATIYNVNGQVCGKLNGNDTERIFKHHKFEKRSLNIPSGTYILRTVFADGNSMSQKITM